MSRNFFRVRTRVRQLYKTLDCAEPPYEWHHVYYIAQYRKWWWPKWRTIENLNTWCDICNAEIQWNGAVEFDSERDALNALETLIKYAI